MDSQVRLAVTICLVCVLVIPLAAYGAPRPQLPISNTPLPTTLGGVIVEVLNDEGAPLPDQALVRLRNLSTGEESGSAVSERSEIRFRGLPMGTYEIEVGAPGYATVVERFEVSPSSFGMERVAVVLKRVSPAGSRTAVPTNLNVPEKARKEAQRGIEALQAGQLKASEKQLLKAYNRYPENANLNYLLAMLYVEKRDLASAKWHLEKAIAADPHHVRALTTLGRLLLQQKDAARAIPYLERAVAVTPDEWLAHSLLANGYLSLADYRKAEGEARSALATGKGDARAARLPLGLALANMGRYPEAIGELESFAREVPGSPLIAEARRVIAQLNLTVAAGAASTPAPVLALSPDVPVLTARDAGLLVASWGPPSVDAVKPPVAPGVSCSERRVIDGVAERLKELIASLARVEAREELTHEELDEIGNPVSHDSRRFSYVAELSEPVPGVPRVDEYRDAPSGGVTFPAGIATWSMPSLAFVFHPDMQASFEFACEGLGELQGRPTWLMHFRQREDRPSKLLSYNLGRGITPVDLQGRAWITPDGFRVVRIEAESVRPLPAIRLLSHHVIVDYGPVVFSQKHMELWLPKKTQLYFQFRGRRYYRRHDFESFRLFSVETTQKVVHPD